MKATAQQPVTVTVLAPYRVSVAGVSYGPGDTAELDADTAAPWVRRGWVQCDQPLPVPTVRTVGGHTAALGLRFDRLDTYSPSDHRPEPQLEFTSEP